MNPAPSPLNAHLTPTARGHSGTHGWMGHVCHSSEDIPHTTRRRCCQDPSVLSLVLHTHCTALSPLAVAQGPSRPVYTLGEWVAG